MSAEAETEVKRLGNALRALKREAFEIECRDPAVTNLLYFIGPRVDAILGEGNSWPDVEVTEDEPPF